MDWLAKYQAQIDCPKQKITLRGPKGEKVVHKGKSLKCGVKPNTAIKGRRLLERGRKRFLYNIVDIETPKLSLKGIPVVQEFLDVFPNEIPSMPLLREIEFCIDLV